MRYPQAAWPLLLLILPGVCPFAIPARPVLAEEPATELQVIRERYPDGAVRVERHVVQKEDGSYVNHGPWTAFYPDGKKIGGGEMLHGKRHGLWKRWFAPGESALLRGDVYAGYQPPFTSIGQFDSGELNGAWIIEDKNKTKISQWHFRQGQPHGLWTWWYPSGQKRREAHYADGALHGEVIAWQPDGRVAAKNASIHGRRKTLAQDQYQPGYKRFEGWYLEPKEYTKTSYDWWAGEAGTEVVGYKGEREKTGKWTYWYPNQQKQSEGAYTAGKPDGHWTWWFENGQKWIEGDYVLGKQSGDWTWWKPDGSIEKKHPFAVVERPRELAAEKQEASLPPAPGLDTPAASAEVAKPTGETAAPPAERPSGTAKQPSAAPPAKKPDAAATPAPKSASAADQIIGPSPEPGADKEDAAGKK